MYSIARVPDVRTLYTAAVLGVFVCCALVESGWLIQSWNMWKSVIVVLVAFCFVPMQFNMFEDAQLDIVFVLDHSQSIKPADWKKTLKLVEKLSDIFPLGAVKTQLSLVVYDDDTYSDDANHQFLTTNRSAFKDGIKNWMAIDPKGNTATDKALKTVMETVLGHQTRPDVPDVVVIVTDGCTNPRGGTEQPDDPKVKQAREQAEQLAKELRDDDVRILLVHVGEQIKCKDHLVAIGGSPDNVYSVDDYDKLEQRFKDMLETGMIEILCKYKKLCYYDEKEKQCVGQWWREKKIQQQYNCTEKKPETEVKCTAKDCKDRCEEALREGCTAICNEDQKGLECIACQRCPTTTRTTTTQLTTTPDGNEAMVEETVDNGETKSRQGLIIGLGLGALCLILLLIALVVVLVARRRSYLRRKRMMEEASLMDQSGKSRSGSRLTKSSTGSTGTGTTGKAMRLSTSTAGRDKTIGPVGPIDSVAERTAAMGVSLATVRKSQSAPVTNATGKSAKTAQQGATAPRTKTSTSFGEGRSRVPKGQGGRGTATPTKGSAGRTKPSQSAITTAPPSGTGRTQASSSGPITTATSEAKTRQSTKTGGTAKPTTPTGPTARTPKTARQRSRSTTPASATVGGEAKTKPTAAPPRSRTLDRTKMSKGSRMVPGLT